MKRITKAVVILGFASTATYTMAGTPDQYGKPIPGDYLQSDVFPNMETHEGEHSDSDEALSAARNRAAERDNFTATESYAQGATRTDVPTQDVNTRDQLEVQSPFPSRGGPIDD